MQATFFRPLVSLFAGGPRDGTLSRDDHSTPEYLGRIVQRNYPTKSACHRLRTSPTEVFVAPQQSLLMTVTVVTRFAPSPTGLLHPGHAYSAITAYETARQSNGRFILRIEDIDFTRCRPEFEDAIYEDLEWLGLRWETPVRRQSEHLAEYQKITDSLKARGLLYPCFCTRLDIQASVAAPHDNTDGIYPGTCRNLSADEQQKRINNGVPFSLRLNMQAAAEQFSAELTWRDLGRGLQSVSPQRIGDVVLARKELGCSYHLCVTCDDALQGITRIIRGVDLFEATDVHRVIQELLGLPVPEYQHHPLLTDPRTGRRLAKRNQSETLRSLRDRGISPEQIRDRFREMTDPSRDSGTVTSIDY
ncbi:MAG: tRNA glutamyl-Q(34) synthetase GluQRS [Planctomyces sp.]